MGVLRATRDLRQQLSATTMEQAGDLGQVTKAGQELVSTIRNLALANDIDRLQEGSDRFHEYIEHILEVSSQTWPTHRMLACTRVFQAHEIFTRDITDWLSQQKYLNFPSSDSIDLLNAVIAIHHFSITISCTVVKSNWIYSTPNFKWTLAHVVHYVSFITHVRC